MGLLFKDFKDFLEKTTFGTTSGIKLFLKTVFLLQMQNSHFPAWWIIREHGVALSDYEDDDGGSCDANWC